MCNILAIGFLVLLYLDAVGALLCNYCRNVQPGNTCKRAEKTCNAGNRKFCFTRLIVKEGHVFHVGRGCSAICQTVKYRSRDRSDKYMLCCNKDHCNQHKVWKYQH